MHLLVVTREFPPHVVGGLSYHLGNLYSEVVEHGHEVTVLAGVCREADERAHQLVHDDINIRPVHYGSFHGHHISYSLALKWALRDVDVDRYDVATTHTQVPFDIGLPTIAKYHDCPREERPYFRREFSLPVKLADSLLDPTRRSVEGRSLIVADHAVFNSHRCERGWRAHYDFATPTTVLHNGVDRDVFYPRDPTHDESYVLFVGDSERKGLPTVLEYARTASLPVYIAGKVDISAPNVRLLDHVSQGRLATLYSDAAVTIHPAQFEAFGNVVLESLSCGTPVVTTPDCGASELLTDQTGVVTDDIASGVEQARQLDGVDCVTLAEQHTWGHVARETLDLVTTFVG